MRLMTDKPQTKSIPTFADEDEERRFWDEHDPSEYFTEPADVIVQPAPAGKRGLPPGRRPR